MMLRMCRALLSPGAAVMVGILAVLPGGCDEGSSDQARGSATAPARSRESSFGALSRALPRAPQAAPAHDHGAPATEPVLVLRSAGAAPWRALRYRLVPGTRETLVMTMDMAIQTRVPGNPATPVEIPTVTMTMQIAIAATPSENEARYDFVLLDTAVTGKSDTMPEVVEATRVAIEQLEGMTGSALVDDRGLNQVLDMKMPAGMLPQMRQIMDSAARGIDQVSTPLPVEPVGPGARWELRQTIAQSGIRLAQVTLFELVELDGDRGRVRATVTQRAEPQTMTLPGMTEGSARLMTLTSRGTNEIQLDLTRLVPTSRLELASDYAVQLDAPSPQVIHTHLDMVVGIGQR